VTAPFAVSFSSVVESIFLVFLLLQWQLPVLPVVCVVLGVLTARKTHRSVFNWVLVGLLNGVIPVLGPILMVIAYFFYPPPAPTVRPGFHPPKSTARGTTRSGERRPQDRR
jgi:hypothetical protein